MTHPQETPTARPPHPQFPFGPAVKTRLPGRIALMGPSGSGKTYTALQLASALGSTTAVIEAVHGHAAKYADRFDFHVCPPLTYCSPEALIAVLAECAARGYQTVIVDPYTLFWSGHGGVLEQVDDATKRGSSGNKSGWGEVRPRERRMWDALFAYPGHVIVTLRSKTEYHLEADEQGGHAMRRFGGRPEHRDGAEYEFNFVGAMDSDNTLVVLKALCVDLSGAVVAKPGADFAGRVRDWLQDGAPSAEPVPVTELIAQARHPEATHAGLGQLRDTVRARFLEDVLMPDDDGVTLVRMEDYITRRGWAVQAAAVQDAPAS
ncbi:AAA family ATPase [Streptomyces sp. NPDC048638]|uniref:AAA family ATPase n=1 Tax=Streptomyces sp. NPDC048638 TaxID=3365580 RepID=UPI00371A9391